MRGVPHCDALCELRGRVSLTAARGLEPWRRTGEFVDPGTIRRLRGPDGLDRHLPKARHYARVRSGANGGHIEAAPPIPAAPVPISRLAAAEGGVEARGYQRFIAIRINERNTTPHRVFPHTRAAARRKFSLAGSCLLGLVCLGRNRRLVRRGRHPRSDAAGRRRNGVGSEFARASRDT